MVGAHSHWYIPSPGQPDAIVRALALGLPLAASNKAAEYGNPPVPCALCDHGGTVDYLAEPTTFAAVAAMHDALVAAGTGDVTMESVTSSVLASIAQHSVAVNPHNLVPATIGAAEDDHTHPFDPHSHADNEIPASIARDTEVTAAARLAWLQ